MTVEVIVEIVEIVEIIIISVNIIVVIGGGELLVVALGEFDELRLVDEVLYRLFGVRLLVFVLMVRLEGEVLVDDGESA